MAAARTLNITGDDQIQLYLDGVASEINTAPGWNDGKVLKTASFPLTTRVLAVQLINTGGPTGLVAAASDNSLVTDSHWVVSTTLVTGWNQPGFDDSGWASAFSQSTFDSSTPYPNAQMIANRDTSSDPWNLTGTLYFRRRLDRQLFITADNTVKLYLDGVESAINALATASDWSQTKVATLPGRTRVIAVQVTNGGGPAGLLASTTGTGDTVLTDESWKVSGIPATGWNLPTFDDSAWGAAVSQGTNGDPTYINLWAARPQIAATAKWIWNRNTKADPWTVDGVLYFRRRLW